MNACIVSTHILNSPNIKDSIEMAMKVLLHVFCISYCIETSLHSSGFYQVKGIGKKESSYDYDKMCSYDKMTFLCASFAKQHLPLT